MITHAEQQIKEQRAKSQAALIQDKQIIENQVKKAQQEAADEVMKSHLRMQRYIKNREELKLQFEEREKENQKAKKSKMTVNEAFLNKDELAEAIELKK